MACAIAMRKRKRISDIVAEELLNGEVQLRAKHEAAMAMPLGLRKQAFPNEFMDGGADPAKIERTRRRLRGEGVML